MSSSFPAESLPPLRFPAIAPYTGGSHGNSEIDETEPPAEVKRDGRALKRRLGPRKCAICGADSMFRYYGVQSCEGCKQFFRRVVTKQKEFHCWKIEKCDLESGAKCRGCRLDACLVAGMDLTLVNGGCACPGEQWEAFVARLEGRRQILQQNARCGLNSQYK